MIKHLFHILITLLLAHQLIACSPTEENLKADLEHAYQRAQTAIQNKQLDSLAKYFEPTKNQDISSITFFYDIAEDIEKLYYSLDKTEFITIRRKDNWAMYYCLSHLEDESTTTVNAYAFHQVNGQWKLSGYSNMALYQDKLSPGSIKYQMDHHPRLQFPRVADNANKRPAPTFTVVEDRSIKIKLDGTNILWKAYINNQFDRNISSQNKLISPYVSLETAAHKYLNKKRGCPR